MRLLASPAWTETLVMDALTRWPGPPYKTTPFISGVCFDNFTVQVNYNTTHSASSPNYRLDMTNWATIYLPMQAAPELNIGQVLLGRCMPWCECGTILYHTCTYTYTYTYT